MYELKKGDKSLYTEQWYLTRIVGSIVIVVSLWLILSAPAHAAPEHTDAPAVPAVFVPPPIQPPPVFNTAPTPQPVPFVTTTPLLPNPPVFTVAPVRPGDTLVNINPPVTTVHRPAAGPSVGGPHRIFRPQPSPQRPDVPEVRRPLAGGPHPIFRPLHPHRPQIRHPHRTPDRQPGPPTVGLLPPTVLNDQSGQNNNLPPLITASGTLNDLSPGAGGNDPYMTCVNAYINNNNMNQKFSCKPIAETAQNAAYNSQPPIKD